MKNILVVSILIFFTIILATGLAVTIKYAYIDEIKQFYFFIYQMQKQI